MDLNSPIFLLYFFLVLFVILFFLIYFLERYKVLRKKYEALSELNYVIKKFHLNKEFIEYKKEILFVAFLDSIIIATVGTFVSSIDIPLFLKFALGFVLLFALIYALFEIYGRHLKNKIRRDKK